MAGAVSELRHIYQHRSVRDCQFEILASDGTERGRFSHTSVKKIIPFLDRFIVTASFGGDLKIWSKTGQELSSQRLGYSYPTLVSNDQAGLVAFSIIEGSFLKATYRVFLGAVFRGNLKS